MINYFLRYLIYRRRIKNFKPQLDAAVDDLNQFKNSKVFNDLYNSAIDYLSYTKNQDTPFYSDDFYSYNNPAFQTFIEYINTHTKYGMTNAILERLKEIKNLSEEELRKTFSFDQSQNISSQLGGKSIAQFTDELSKEVKELSKFRKNIDLAYQLLHYKLKTSKDETPQELKTKAEILKDCLYGFGATIKYVDKKVEVLKREIIEETNGIINPEPIFFYCSYDWENEDWEKINTFFALTKIANEDDLGELIEKVIFLELYNNKQLFDVDIEGDYIHIKYINDIKEKIKNIDSEKTNQISDKIAKLEELYYRRRLFYAYFNFMQKPANFNKIRLENLLIKNYSFLEPRTPRPI